MGAFLRANITDDNFIRGAARLLVAPAGEPFPASIGAIIRLASGGVTNEVQSITVTGGTGGAARYDFRGAITAAVNHNANAATVQAAFEALSTIEVGDIVAAGGPLNTAPVTITFQGGLAGQNVEQITVANDNITGSDAVVATTTQGVGQYDPVGNWSELGATKTGVQIVRNNAEETFDVDQIMGDIASEPTNWEMNIGTQLAEVTLATVDLAWEGGTIVNNFPANEPAEKHLPVGMPTSYSQKLLAVLHKRPNDKIRAHVFRKVQRMPQESTFTFAKAGEQISVPVRFRAIADSAITDLHARFGSIIDQV